MILILYRICYAATRNPPRHLKPDIPLSGIRLIRNPEIQPDIRNPALSNIGLEKIHIFVVGHVEKDSVADQSSSIRICYFRPPLV